MTSLNIYAIVVTYNGTKWVHQCLSSLQHSTVPLHIISIDNASADDTVSAIKKDFPGIQLISNDTNLGFGQANNIGLKIAVRDKADYVFLLNQDARIKENTIEELLKAGLKNKEYGILSPFHLDVSEQHLEPLFQQFLSVEYTPGFISDQYTGRVKPVYPTRFIHAAAWLLSRECVETVGGFDPLYFHYGEDDDYLQRTAYFKYKIGLVPAATIIHDSDFKGWHQMEYNVNRNRIIAYQHLKKMSPNYRSNVLTFFKNGFDEMTTLLLLRKFKKFRFRFSLLFKTMLGLRRVHRSYKASFKKGAFLLND